MEVRTGKDQGGLLIGAGDFDNEISGICEYINIPGESDTLIEFWAQVIAKEQNLGIGEARHLVGCHSYDSHNIFGKTLWQSYALADLADEDNGNAAIFEPLIAKYRKVHPHFQLRSTGFNFSDSTEKELYVHTDLDPRCEHPNYFNIILPVVGRSRIDYYETRAEEVWLPERNSRKEYYYHEFKAKYKFDKEHNRKRLIGNIHVDNTTGPVLLDTDVLHGVQVLEAPRLAFCVRFNNIPAHMDFHAFKKHAEGILNDLG
jgi:hypothetical protein